MAIIKNESLALELAQCQQELRNVKEELAATKAEYQEFTYIVSHDLSAPLRQISGFSDIIVAKYGQEFDEKTNKHFDLIMSGTTHMKDIISALVDFSRVNTRVQPHESVDIKIVIDKNIEKLSPLISSKNADITYENMPTIECDNAQILQVFYHLIHNALHFQLAETSPKITISANNIEGTWEFCITDNGIGIAESLDDKIFKVFRRGVSNKQYKGMGMGLAVCKKIVELHNGSMWFKSTKNKGSSFYFTIGNSASNER